MEKHTPRSNDDRVPLQRVPRSVFYRGMRPERYTSGTAAERFERRLAQERQQQRKRKPK
jgi:hypothetical protein